MPNDNRPALNTEPARLVLTRVARQHSEELVDLVQVGWLVTSTAGDDTNPTPLFFRMGDPLLPGRLTGSETCQAVYVEGSEIRL